MNTAQTQERTGRPSKDLAWTELIRHSDLVITDKVEENDQMLAELTDGATWSGCQLKPKGKEDRPHWYCKFYLGGKQRVIGKGTLYQCAKLYDCALIFFDKYRARRDQWGNRQFNFSEEVGKTAPAIEQYFQSLEKHLLLLGALLHPADKSCAQREAQRKSRQTWQRKQTIAFQVKSYIDDLSVEIIRLNSEVAECNRKLDLLLAQKTTPLTFSPGSR